MPSPGRPASAPLSTRPGQLGLGIRDQDVKRRMASHTLHPNCTVIPIHQLLYYGESDSCSRIRLGRVQSLKNAEDALVVVRVNPDAVVGNTKMYVSFSFRCTDLDYRRNFQ